MKTLFALGLTVSAFALLTTFAHADDVKFGQRTADHYSKFADQDTDKDWRVSVGAGAFFQPEYEGGDEYEVNPLPFLDVRYKDIVELGPRGLDVNVINQNGFKAGVGLGANFGRDEDDADRLEGLGDVDATAEGRLFVGYRAGPVNTELAFEQDLGDGHEGYTIEASVGTRVPVPLGEHSVMLLPSVSTTYADDNYMESFFGVNNVQSARSGLARFDSEAGFKDVAFGTVARYQISEHWSLNGIGQYQRLLGDAADSPIVENENQFTFGTFIAYMF